MKDDDHEKHAIVNDSSEYAELKFIIRDMNEELSRSDRYKDLLTRMNFAFEFYGIMRDKNAKLLEIAESLNKHVVEIAERANIIVKEMSADEESIGLFHTEFEKAKQALQVARSKDENCKCRIDELKMDISIMREKADMAVVEDLEIKNAQKAIEDLKLNIEEMKTTYTGLNESFVAQSNLNKLDDQAISALHKEYEDMQSDLTLQESRFKSLRKTNLDYIPQYNNFNEQIKTVQAKYAENVQKLEECKSDEDKKKELAQLKSEYNLEVEMLSNLKKLHAIKSNSLDVIKSGTIENENKIKEIRLKLEEKEGEIKKLRKRLFSINKETNCVKAHVDEMKKKRLNIRQEKLDTNKESFSMNNKLLELKYEENRQKLANNNANIQIQASQVTINKNKRDITHEEVETETLISQQKVILEEANVIKSKQQVYKFYMQRIDNDIEVCDKELVKLRAYAKVSEEHKRELDKKNYEMSEYLKSVNDKINYHSKLVDKLKTEKNLFEKLAESARKETKALQRNFDDLIQVIKSMTYRIEYLTRITARDRERCFYTKESIVAIEEIKEQCRAGIKQSDCINGKLLSEKDALNNILIKIECEYKQRLKVFGQMKDSHKLLNKQVLDKEKKIKELKDKIECDSITIHLKSDEYRYVCENLCKLSNDIKYYSDINIELAKKCAHKNEVRCHVNLLLSQIAQEQLKNRALIEDYKRPRNVHFLTVLNSVDHTKYMQIKLRQKLAYDLTVAERKCQKLNATLNGLKEKYNNMRSSLNQGESIESIATTTELYNDLLEHRQCLMDQWSKLQDENFIELKNKDYKNRDIRVRLSRRRQMAAEAKFNNQSIKNELNKCIKASKDEFFVTEPQIVTTFGGGFNPRPPRTARDSKRFSNHWEHVLNDPIVPKSARGQRAKLLIPGLKKAVKKEMSPVNKLKKLDLNIFDI